MPAAPRVDSVTQSSPGTTVHLEWSDYTSAHTIVSNIAVFTYPGTDPAYIMTDVMLIGTGGLTVLGAGEAVSAPGSKA